MDGSRAFGREENGMKSCVVLHSPTSLRLSDTFSLRLPPCSLSILAIFVHIRTCLVYAPQVTQNQPNYSYTVLSTCGAQFHSTPLHSIYPRHSRHPCAKRQTLVAASGTVMRHYTTPRQPYPALPYRTDLVHGVPSVAHASLALSVFPTGNKKGIDEQTDGWIGI